MSVSRARIVIADDAYDSMPGVHHHRIRCYLIRVGPTTIQSIHQQELPESLTSASLIHG